MTPKPNQHFAKSGFVFRVDRVTAKHIYVSRMKEGGGLIVPLRVTVRTWDKEMGDAKRVKSLPPWKAA